jgi:hypothetical protein
VASPKKVGEAAPPAPLPAAAPEPEKPSEEAKPREEVKKKWTPDSIHRRKNVDHYEGESEFSTFGPRPKPVNIEKPAPPQPSDKAGTTKRAPPPKGLKG